MDHLDMLESKSIFIMREAFKKFKKLAMLWSVGKDSTTMIALARKAFFGRVPFPVIHIDTGKKFKEMYAFRDKCVKDWNLNLIISRNEEADRLGIGPQDKIACCNARKTEALKQTMAKYGFEALILGIRRDEHGIRAKERVFSPRTKDFMWDYKDQPPELWDQFKTKRESEQHLRIHPLLHWTETDVWEYVKREGLPVNPLYFAKKRNVNGKKNWTRYRCFSEDTKLLTDDGLKGINEITKESNVATLNNEGVLEYQNPKNIFRYHYEGKLLKISNASVNLLITPNHRLFYRKRYQNYYKNKRIEKIKFARKKYITALKLRKKGHTHKQIAKKLKVSRPTVTRWLNGTTKPLHFAPEEMFAFELKEAENVFKKLKHESIELKRDCDWVGKNKKKFKIPEKFLKTKTGKIYLIKNQKHEFELKYWLRFFGWYLSEGSSSGKQISICQNKCTYYDEIYKDSIILGLSPKKRKDRIIISNAPLSRYLKTFGTSKEKFVPKWIKGLNKKLLSNLMDTLMKGDGSFNKNGTYKKYVTTSYKLANDILEIGLKLGYPVSLKKDRQTWIIWFSGKSDSTPRLSNPPKSVSYDGKVWCVEVGNNVIMAEREGRLCWTGNSLGCETCTAPVKSTAKNIDEIIEEIKTTKVAERSGRSQDKERAYAMQKLRMLGYM